MRKNIGAKARGFPTPIVLVGTTDAEGRHNLVTLAWAGICCSEPPSIQVSLRPSRHSHAAIVASKVFSVNIPSQKYVVETDFCGIASGRDTDKPAVAGLSIALRTAKDEIDACFDRLEAVTVEHDKQAAAFDARLAELR